MTSDPNDADRAEILDLVADAVEVLDQDGEAAFAAFCAGLPRHQDAVLARVQTLRSVGLVASGRASTADVPRHLGDFELHERIGGGGMGVVYRATQVSRQREVALKLIRPDQLYFPGVRERFQREIAIVARLQHDGIVRLHSFGEDRGLPWFAMERVDGISLARVLADFADRNAAELSGRDLARAVGVATAATTLPAVFAGSWPVACLRIVEQAALAVAAAHAEGVLHRDLKPSNVMLTPAGRVVLLDFGLAWTRGTDRLTRSGSQLGTVHYMAPEQLAAAPTSDERTDVYALGVVLRELLTLRPAFTGATFEAVAQRVRLGLAVPLGPASRIGGRDAASVCAMAMERDRERRYPTARAFANDLRHVLERKPVAAVPPSVLRRCRLFAERHRALTAAASVALVGLLATPLAIAWRERALRLELQASNGELAAQVARADINMTLAASALGQMLQRIDDEGLVQVPDIRQFCDDVLADTNGFLDALVAVNPADPASRLGLAETLARAGFVRWQFLDLPRTQALFGRARELLAGCSADVDRIDTVDIEVTLAMVFVERSPAPRVDEAYDGLLQRVLGRGPLAQRPAAIRRLVARTYQNYGESLFHRRDPRAVAMLTTSRVLCTELLAAAPSVQATTALGSCETFLAEVARRERRSDDEHRHLDASLALARRACALPTGTVDERLTLSDWLGLLASRLNTRQQHEAALAMRGLQLDQLATLIAARPTRLRGLCDWSAASRARADLLRRLGRTGPAVAALREVCQRMEPTLTTWPRSTTLWREVIHGKLELAHIAVAGGEVDRTTALTELETTVLACRRTADRGAVLAHLCASSLLFLARDRTGASDLDRALVLCQEARGCHAEALELSSRDKVRISPDTEHRQLHAEILLQRGDVEAALPVLQSLGTPLSEATRSAIPALARWRDDPRLQALSAPPAGR